MATYTWATDAGGVDGLTVVSGTILASQAVTLDLVFGGIVLSSQDSYRPAIKATSIVLDSGAGGASGFSLTANGNLGDAFVTTSSGDAANLADGDVVIIRDGSDTMINQLRAAVSGGTIPLEGLLTQNFSSATATIERAPRVEVTGVEGVGGVDQGAPPLNSTSRTERIWLTEPQFGDWYPARLRYDPGSTMSIATFDWTGTIEVVEWIDAANIYRSDRRTQRALFTVGSIAAPQAVTPFSLHFLSNGSGGQRASKGYALSGSEFAGRYAEQHPPIRLNIDISGFSVAGNVVIEGFRTIWSPIREILPMTTTTQVRISPENFEQFQTGDVVDLWNIATDVTEQRTISTKTAPDIITMTAAVTGTYEVDDVIGILQAETVAVAAAGTVHTADAWVYPLTHEATGTYTYNIAQSVQGLCGALATVDPHVIQNAAVEVRQNEGHYSLNVKDLTYGNGSDPTIIGGPSGVTLILRDANEKFISAASDTCLWWGYKDAFGNSTSAAYLSRGRAVVDQIWNVTGNATNILVMLKSTIANPRISSRLRGGGQSVGVGAKVRIRDTYGLTNDTFLYSTGDIEIRDCKFSAEGANEIALTETTSGAAFFLRSATTLESVRVLGATSGYVQGAIAAPLTEQGIIRVNEYNLVQTDYPGAGVGFAASRPVNFGISCDLRLFNSLSSGIDMQDLGGPLGTQIRSGITVDVNVINETGDVIEDARVILVDTTGVEQFDTTTDEFGNIAKQEVIVEQFENTGVFGGGTAHLGDATPAGLTRTLFSPFELIVLPTSDADGYVPTHVNFNVVPWIATESKNFTIVLHVPRPDGQFGDAGFDEF